VRYLSVCSGIEAATVAWRRLGWTAVAFSEVDAFPSAVLAHRFPNTANWGDMESFHEWPAADVDVLVGGTPCQSFSVAGLRRGMADPRGNLTLTYLAIAERYRPRWLVWENVPGVLSADGGRAFGAFLGGLEELGYGWAYRTLDAQYFGLAQRRRRVFVVASARGWPAAGSVLFESESLWGDSAPSREAGESPAPSLAARTRGGGGLGTDTELDGGLIPSTSFVTFDTSQITSKTNRSQPQSGDPCHPLVAQDDAPTIAFHNRQDPDISGDVTHPLGAKDNGHAVAFNESQSGVREGGPHPTIDANKGTRRMEGVRQGMSVRRLTPRECERLQGFPDDWTAVPYRGKSAEACPDGPRYKALGNSMAVPVVRWIGERIAEVDSELQYSEGESNDTKE